MKSIEIRRHLFFQGLVHHYVHDEKENLYAYLPKEEESSLKEIVFPEEESFSYDLFDLEKQLSQIHYSWIWRKVSKQPEPFQQVLIASVDQKLQAQLMSFNPQLLTIKKPAERICLYFREWLAHQVMEKHVIPKSLLPKTELALLLDMSHVELVKIIHFLGLNDLSVELRLILDTAQLNGIFSVLTPEDRQYIRSIIKSDEQVPIFPPLGLKGWKIRDPLFLYKIIHKRGLMRFAIALYRQDRHFLWHLLHQLDTGRARIILECLKEKVAAVQSINLCQRQIYAILTYFKSVS